MLAEQGRAGRSGACMVREVINPTTHYLQHSVSPMGWPSSRVLVIVDQDLLAGSLSQVHVGVGAVHTT